MKDDCDDHYSHLRKELVVNDGEDQIHLKSKMGVSVAPQNGDLVTDKKRIEKTMIFLLQIIGKVILHKLAPCKKHSPHSQYPPTQHPICLTSHSLTIVSLELLAPRGWFPLLCSLNGNSAQETLVKDKTGSLVSNWAFM